MRRPPRQIDCPPFAWNAEPLRRAEWIFLGEAALAAGAARHLPPGEQGELVVDSLSGETAASAEIDGEVLPPVAVGTCVRREMRLSFDEAATEPRACAAARLTVDVFQRASRHLGMRTLLEWGALASTISPPGAARFELRSFVRWYGRTASAAGDAASPLTRAGLAHLWIESIHPWPDATGVLGRAVALRSILQGFPEPAFVPLSPFLLRRRKEYHRALDEACREGDATDWLVWFAAAVIESGREHRARIEFAVAGENMLRALRDRIRGRQETALRHLLRQGPDARHGGLTVSSYAALAGVPEAVAEKDMAELLSLGALSPVQCGGGIRHRLNICQPSVEKVRMEDILH